MFQRIIDILEWAEFRVDLAIIAIGELAKTYFQEVWRLVFRIATLILTILLGFLHRPSFEKYIAEQRGRIHTQPKPTESENHHAAGRIRSRSVGESKPTIRRDRSNPAYMESKKVHRSNVGVPSASVSPSTPHHLSSSHMDPFEVSPLELRKSDQNVPRSQSMLVKSSSSLSKNATSGNAGHGDYDNMISHSLGALQSSSYSGRSSLNGRSKSLRHLSNRARLTGFAGLLDDDEDDNEHSDRDDHDASVTNTMEDHHGLGGHHSLSDFEAYGEYSSDQEANSMDTGDDDYDEYYGAKRSSHPKPFETGHNPRRKPETAERLFSIEGVEASSPLLDNESNISSDDGLVNKSAKSQNTTALPQQEKPIIDVAETQADPPHHQNIHHTDLNASWSGFLLSTITAVAEEAHNLAQSQLIPFEHLDSRHSKDPSQHPHSHAKYSTLPPKFAVNLPKNPPPTPAKPTHHRSKSDGLHSSSSIVGTSSSNQQSSDSDDYESSLSPVGRPSSQQAKSSSHQRVTSNAIDIPNVANDNNTGNPPSSTSKSSSIASASVAVTAAPSKTKKKRKSDPRNQSVSASGESSSPRSRSRVGMVHSGSGTRKHHRYATINVNKDRIFTSEKINTGVLEDLRMWCLLTIDSWTDQCRSMWKWSFGLIRRMIVSVLNFISAILLTFTSISKMKQFIVYILNPLTWFRYIWAPIKFVHDSIVLCWKLFLLFWKTFVDPSKLKEEADDERKRNHDLGDRGVQKALNEHGPRSKYFDTRNVQDIVTSQGYPYESYQVTTEDGYILKLDRLARKESKRVVYFQHGVVDNSFAWFGHVDGDAASAMAFRVFDAGHDVFVGTLRGCSGSTNHIRQCTSSEYWNFTVNEHGMYDIKAFISKIVEIKKKELGNDFEPIQCDQNLAPLSLKPEDILRPHSPPSPPTPSDTSKAASKSNVLISQASSSSNPASRANKFHLVIIAHSMGAMATLIYLVWSKIQQTKHRTTAAILLSPAGYHKTAPSIVYWAGPLLNFLLWLFPMVHVLKFPSDFVRLFIAKVIEDVNNSFTARRMVSWAVSKIIGGSIEENTFVNLRNLTYNVFSGTSVGVFRHFWQVWKHQKFEGYDYGKDQNLKFYGSETPVNFHDHFHLLDLPIHFAMGLNDTLIEPISVISQYAILKDAKPELAHLKAFAKMGHLDFTIGANGPLIQYIVDTLSNICTTYHGKIASASNQQSEDDKANSEANI